MNRLSVVVPVFNEVGTVVGVLRRVLAQAKGLQAEGLARDIQIVVVDDCSTDGTSEALEALRLEMVANAYPGGELVVTRHEKNQGKGAAIRTGLGLVTGEYLMIQDADLEYQPEDIPGAMRLMERGRGDAVYGSRFLGPHRVFMVWHLMANKVLTWLVNLVCDASLGDMETGFKVFRTEMFRSLDIRSEKFDFEVEVTIKLFRRRARVYEMPVTYLGRSYAEGKKITWKDGVHAVWAILYWGCVARKD